MNIKGVFLGLQEVATRLDDRGRVIIFFSSVTGLMLPTYGVYLATKAVLDLLTGVLAKNV
ncbi:SDR family NAD(P)-dependent oxidoreductase [Microcoleus asticus]|uniref:SDR family NAD(P)-dependent oxidoreductase n=1 Tax=Microcoleus asticus TaxID=2815231 RepID=UPI003BB55EAA